MSKTIIKNIFSSTYKMQESALKGSMLVPDVEVKFTVKPFADRFMAYVEFEYLKNKTDKETTLFNGNSLWKIGDLEYKNLIDKIESYKSVEEVILDFDC